MAASLYHWFYQYQVSQCINVTVKHIGSLLVSIWKVHSCICTHRNHYLLHELGIPRKLRVAFCHCEPDIVTLIRLNYWPATPARPSIAFSFALLDWLQALLLECQVPVQDFSNALKYIISTQYGKVWWMLMISSKFITHILYIDAMQHLPRAYRSVWGIQVYNAWPYNDRCQLYLFLDRWRALLIS